MIEIDAFGYLNIGRSAVTFASSTFHVPTSASDEDEDDGAAGATTTALTGADVRAFVGMADAMLDMLQDILNSPAAPFSSSEDMIDSVHRYIATHQSATTSTPVGIDTKHQLFDFSRGTSPEVSGKCSILRKSVVNDVLQGPRRHAKNREHYEGVMLQFDHLVAHPVAYTEVEGLIAYLLTF